MPFFSIIIPVYNVAPYLRECLDSVLAQTFTDWESICVDDGSTDGSGAILDEYAAKDTRFRVIHQPNAGVSVARNKALDTVRGEWFLFLDGDDVLRKDALGIFVPLVGKNQCDGILVQPYIPGWDGKVIPQRKINTCVLKQEATKEDLVFGQYAANGFPFSRIYRTDLFRCLRFPVGVKMAEDINFWFDALSIPAKWMILNAEYYLYRQRPDSVCGLKSPKDCEAMLDAALYAANKIENELGFGKDGGRRYFERWPWASTEYLKIFIARYKGLDVKSRDAVFEKARRIRNQIGMWPYTRRMKWDLWLLEHRLGCLRPLLDFVQVVRSFTRRIMRLLYYIRKNGIGFAFGKIKRQILHEGEYVKGI